MIAQLTGQVLRVENGAVVLDVGGIGFQVFSTAAILDSLEEGSNVTLQTYLVGRVQPDFDLALYGFRESSELKAFRMLLDVSGVGAKVAIALLSTFSVGELARALSSNDSKTLTKTSGVGPKLAQRMCLELGDKMAAFVFTEKTERAEATANASQENAIYEDVLEGLVGLGYSRADARRAADKVFASAQDRTNTTALLSAALQLLNSGKR